MSLSRILLTGFLPRSETGQSYLTFDRMTGIERVNELYEYQLIVKTQDEFGHGTHGVSGLSGYVSQEMAKEGLSPGQHLDLSSLIGQQMGVVFGLGDIEGEYYIHGMINRIQQLNTSNYHSLYQINLVPWLWLLTKQSNYRIFQNKSVVEILKSVFNHYPYGVDYQLSGEYGVLDYQVQYGESDYEFVLRLLQEHGINYYFKHEREQHILVLVDSNAQFMKQGLGAYQHLEYYLPEQRMPERYEYVERFERHQQLVSGQVLLGDYQFKQPSLHQHVHGEYYWSTHHHNLQVYEWNQGGYAEQLQGERRMQVRGEMLYQEGQRAVGYGQLLGLAVGQRFELSGHPDAQNNQDWLVIGIQKTIQPVQSQEGNGTRQVEQYYQASSEFVVQSSQISLRPVLSQEKPLARSQTAMVVGPEGEEIYTDEYGRVKVKFHWDRPSYAQRRLVFSQQEEKELNTCWLRVSNGWSGEHYGMIQLPRVGQEVIVDFFNGDPSMPYVSGRLNNAEQMPIWQLPSQKVLSGIKSKEYKGEQSNQLVLDDSTGKVQVHLKSDHASSELNLGHITRIKPLTGREEEEYRGEGFELRTDGHGVVRADKGMVITTHGRKGATSHVKDIKETTAQLENATSTHLSLIQSSIQAQCEERSLDETLMPTLDELNTSMTGEGIKSMNDSHTNSHDDDLDDTPNHPELSNPHIAFSSLAGMTLTAKQNIHITTQNNLAITTDKDLSLGTTSKYNLTVQNGIRAFSQTGGIKHYTAKDDIELQAQDGQIKHIAKDNIQIISTEGRIQITSPTELSIKVAGSELKINEHGIFITTPKIFQVKSNEAVIKGGEKVEAIIPKLKHLFFGQYIITSSRTNKPLANYQYQINIGHHKKIQGRTNARGETMIVTTAQAENLELVNNKPKPIKTRSLYVAGKGSMDLFFEYIDDE